MVNSGINSILSHITPTQGSTQIINNAVKNGSSEGLQELSKKASQCITNTVKGVLAATGVIAADSVNGYDESVVHAMRYDYYYDLQRLKNFSEGTVIPDNKSYNPADMALFILNENLPAEMYNNTLSDYKSTATRDENGGMEMLPKVPDEKEMINLIEQGKSVIYFDKIYDKSGIPFGRKIERFKTDKGDYCIKVFSENLGKNSGDGYKKVYVGYSDSPSVNEFNAVVKSTKDKNGNITLTRFGCYKLETNATDGKIIFKPTTFLHEEGSYIRPIINI